MADEEARAKLLASMGIKRRGDAGAAAPDPAVAPDVDGDEADAGDDEPEPDEAEGGMEPAEPEPAATATAAPAAPAAAPPAEAPKKDARAGLGLGSRREKPSAEPKREADGKAAEKPADKAGNGAGAATAEAPTEKAPPTVRLGNDEAATLMANYFRMRPNIRDLMERTMPRVFDLKRTHGRYLGDGRPERKLWVGFEPALVLFTLPPYVNLPEHQPTVEKNSGKVVFPDLMCPQPRYTPDGFIVDLLDQDGQPLYNVMGDWYLYVVFRSDGQPIEVEAEAPKKAEKKASSGGLGLGIKRRK